MAAFLDDGWDCRAALTGDQVWRGPRRPEVAERLLSEVSLLGWLADQLPLPVPQPVVHSDEPLRVRHTLLPGDPDPGTDPERGRQLGDFAAALHRIDLDEAVAHGALSAERAAAEAAEVRDRCAREVVPLLDPQSRIAGLGLLMRLTQAEEVLVDAPALIHRDLTAVHIRTAPGRPAGIIDWLDAGAGDPALDLAWGLHGTSPAYAAAFGQAYGVDDELAARARDWWLLAPWHGVLHALDQGQDPTAALAAVAARFSSRANVSG